MWISRYIRRLKEHMRRNKKSFIFYSILRILVILIMIRCILLGNYESAAICILSLILFLMPTILETTLQIRFSTSFEIMIYLFIFAAEILGEISNYYVLIEGWDTMLHTVNGFLCAAVGFSLVEIMNRHGSGMKLSPFYLCLVAFCFSMTIGILWEFFEFTMDQFFGMDMQKDFIITRFTSYAMPQAAVGEKIFVNGIAQTLITQADGGQYVIDGYIDIGLIDTMKDLFVNFLGALTFSLLCYVQMRKNHTMTSGIVQSLMIERTSPDPEELFELQ